MMKLPRVLYGRNLLLMYLIVSILFSLTTVSVVVQAHPQPSPVSFYVKMPNGYIPGVAPNGSVSVEVWINSTADAGIVATGISIAWDPAVLELGYTLILPPPLPPIILDVVEGDFFTGQGFTTTFVKGGINQTAGNVTLTSIAIEAWAGLPHGQGANGTGLLVTYWFTSKNETAYSPLDLIDTDLNLTRFGTHDGTFTPDVIVDGHYNPQPKGSLSGKVTDNSTGVAIPGATVSHVSGPTAFAPATTIADGTYTISDLSLGNYSVKASATGYQDQTKNITITEGPNTLNFTLTSRALLGWIEGFVIDNATKAAIAGATVMADGAFATTIDTGYYKITSLRPKDYTVTAGAVGYPPQSNTATVPLGAGTILNFTLNFVSPYIAVVPHGTMDPDLEPGENFTVSIYTDYAGDDVWAWQFTLTYNPNVLHGIKVTNGDLITKAKNTRADFVSGTFDNEAGTLSLTGAFFFPLPPPIPVTSGPGTLANVTFTVVGVGTSNITLGPKTGLGGINATTGVEYNIIDAATMPDHIQHGFFLNLYAIYVDPTTTLDPTLVPGENYTISIKTNYNGTDIWGWEFTLTYNPNVLSGISVTNGDLITTDKDPSAMFQRGDFNNTEGTLSLTGAGFQYPETPLPVTSGPGTLANVTFTIVGKGTSHITLGPETKLIGANATTGVKYNIMLDQISHGYFDNTLHDIAVTNVTPSTTSVFVGEPIEIRVDVKNVGGFNETFTVTVYADMNITVIGDEITVGTQTNINLTTGNSTTLTFVWNTADVSPASYTITAKAILAKDANPTNNKQTKSVTVKLPTGNIAGTVTDASTGDSIEGANVTANGYSAITNGTGYYIIENVPEGTYNVTANKSGYQLLSKTGINVVAEETTTVNFTLTLLPTTGTIAGNVMDSSTGEPISGATVTANGMSATTNSSGAYVISGVQPGNYTVTVSADGYESDTKSATVVAGQTTPVDFELTPTPTPPPGIPWYLYAGAVGAVAILILIVAFYFLKIKKPKPT